MAEVTSHAPVCVWSFDLGGKIYNPGHVTKVYTPDTTGGVAVFSYFYIRFSPFFFSNLVNSIKGITTYIYASLL